MGDISTMIGKPLAVGAVSALAASFLLADTSSVRAFGMSLSPVTMVFVATAGASVVSEIAHQYILPEIPGNQKFAHFESMIYAPIVNGVTLVILLGPVLGVLQNYPAGFAFGFGGEIAGQYTFETAMSYGA